MLIIEVVVIAVLTIVPVFMPVMIATMVPAAYSKYLQINS